MDEILNQCTGKFLQCHEIQLAPSAQQKRSRNVKEEIIAPGETRTIQAKKRLSTSRERQIEAESGDYGQNMDTIIEISPKRRGWHVQNEILDGMLVA